MRGVLATAARQGLATATSASTSAPAAAGTTVGQVCAQRGQRPPRQFRRSRGASGVLKVQILRGVQLGIVKMRGRRFGRRGIGE